MNTEVLRTARLLLREFDAADAAMVCQMLNEPAYVGNIRDALVRTPEQAARFIAERLRSTYSRPGYGFWAVQRLADGAVLGLCGIIHREGLPCPDLGYALLRQHWGQGYAREAARACVQHADTVLQLPRLLATTKPENHTSQRLLLDLGFVDLGQQQTEAHPDGPSQLFERQHPRTQGRPGS
ncbi:GNAT family N-acetyltransferase [Roseateles sp. BYS180W]|uniref:GNAT family N-acetyltransferase n=1 Tax=Roseateles rivi TaxID=3299028 RepID=A0ABW7FTD7_9BURK